MKITLFYHSLVSDWNHGNAHFLRGVCTELLNAGHELVVLEPINNWSLSNLLQENENAIEDFKKFFPQLQAHFYDPKAPELDRHLRDADLVIVHEWNEHPLVQLIGELKAVYQYQLLFHDTHHRAVTDSSGIGNYDLTHYDGVLAFGDVIRDLYLQNKWAKRAWTWHEAADTSIFKPHPETEKQGDLVWIGNWGDDERTEELIEFLINPVKELGIRAKMYGVRYPQHALDLLQDAGIEYGGYLPSYRVPEVFAQYHFTIHVPRRPYTQHLPGIPTIRPFEALACGIPLICSPWNDAENLFTVNEDFLMVNNGREMKEAMINMLAEPGFRERISASGLATIRKKHTCKHRVEQLLSIYQELDKNQINSAIL